MPRRYSITTPRKPRKGGLILKGSSLIKRHMFYLSQSPQRHWAFELNSWGGGIQLNLPFHCRGTSATSETLISFAERRYCPHHQCHESGWVFCLIFRPCPVKCLPCEMPAPWNEKHISPGWSLINRGQKNQTKYLISEASAGSSDQRKRARDFFDQIPPVIQPRQNRSSFVDKNFLLTFFDL